MQGERRAAGPAMRSAMRSAMGAALRWARARGLGMAMVLAVGPGCDGPEPVIDALLVGTIDTHHFCDMDDVVEVRLQAHWEDCAEGEEGCEPPPRTQIEGDRYSCPATDGFYHLGVALAYSGRYRIEAVAVLTTGEPRRECFIDPYTDDAHVELPRRRLVGLVPVVLDEHEPCPP